MGRTNVSADSIPLMSDTGETSSSAAARGRTFLPAFVAGMSTWEYSPAMLAIRAARFSASWLA